MGRIKTERPKDPYNATISREDVANVIAYCLTSEKVKGKLYELYSGNDSIESVFKNKVWPGFFAYELRGEKFVKTSEFEK